MNPPFSRYCLFEKQALTLLDLPGEGKWERFISGFNKSERVSKVFNAVQANRKDWLIFPEYGFQPNEYPNTGNSCIHGHTREDEFISGYFDAEPLGNDETICIDITGFMRPHLMYMMRYLYEKRIKTFDLLYSEPLTYSQGEKTAFSDEIVTEIRQVCGFEGEHTPTVTGDFLVVGCGYDHKLVDHITNHKIKAKKIQLFPFPALRPHMYQENRVRTQRSAEAFGPIEGVYYASAHDPFITAEVLHVIAEKHSAAIKNLYLSPLATKPQVVGFALFYLLECLRKPVSIIFPFSNGYSQRTSEGVSSIWRYKIDFSIS